MVEVIKPWLWRPPDEARCIGKRGLGRKDGREKAGGTAIYAQDVYLPGMLYAKFLTSCHAHAKIKRMDTSKAKTLPGVFYILRYDDPDVSLLPWMRTGGASDPPDARGGWCWPLLGDTPQFYGQPVGAAVVADREETCDRALKLISENTEWEELPFVLDPEESLKAGAPILWPEASKGDNVFSKRVTNYGDVEAGLKAAEKIIEFQIAKEEDVAGVGGACTVADWRGDHLYLWHHGLAAKSLEIRMAKLCPANKVHVYAPYNAAHFGGKTWTMSTEYTAPIAALAAKRTGRPVKARHESAENCGMEEAFGYYYFKVGFKNDGTVTAVDLRTTFASKLGNHPRHLYDDSKVGNVRCTATIPFINRPPHMCYKEGAPACIIQTMVFARVAAELGMDPTKVALINDGCEGHDMAWIAENVKKVQGFDATRDSLKEVLEIGKRAVDWDHKWHPPGARILPNGNYHGIGFTWVLAWATTLLGVEGHRVAIGIRRDGTALMAGRHPDAGWGPWTAYVRVAADEMGLRYEDFDLRAFDEYGFHIRGGGGSSGMISNLASVIPAARKAKQELLELATSPWGKLFAGKKVEELDIKDSIIFEKANPANKHTVAQLMANFPSSPSAYFNCFILGEPFALGLYQSATYGVDKLYAMPRQCNFEEVEVDPETGKVEVTKVVIVNDVGKVIDPDSCNGQQYGGTYMGGGRSLTEAFCYDPQTGVKLNDNLIDYKPLLMNDLGPIDCHLVETGLAYGPYGTAGIGESSAATITSIQAPAVYNAIGKWIDLPITPDKVLKALGKI
jgi:CO/xanthine dehydrogenase Mo-binding subunit